MTQNSGAMAPRERELMHMNTELQTSKAAMTCSSTCTVAVLKSRTVRMTAMVRRPPGGCQSGAVEAHGSAKQCSGIGRER